MRPVPRKQYSMEPRGRTMAKGFGWFWWKGHVVLECPWGHRSTFNLHPTRGHMIDDDGTVSPSADCPDHGCPFHEFVRLEQWSPTPPEEDA